MNDKDIQVELDDYGQIVGKARKSEEFVPPPPPPRTPPQRGDGSGGSVSGPLVGVLGLVIIGVICIGAVGLFLLLRLQPAPSSAITSPPDVVATESSNEQLAPTDHSVAAPTDTPHRVTQSPTNTPKALPSPVSERTSIGQSAGGRDLSVTIVGYKGGIPVVVVGSIEGDQISTRTLVDALINYYRQDEKVPEGVVFYFIPSINPDGNASNSRYNAHGVDLNRNWDTSDWKSNAAVPGYPNGKAGAGGSYPFSEPEIVALRDLLNGLKANSSRLRAVVLHASVQVSNGEVYPGGDSATTIANAYADAAHYGIEYGWDQYTTSGEAITWCDEQGIPSIDIVNPASQGPSSRVYGSLTLLDVTVQGLEAITR